MYIQRKFSRETSDIRTTSVSSREVSSSVVSSKSSVK